MKKTRLMFAVVSAALALSSVTAMAQEKPAERPIERAPRVPIAAGTTGIVLPVEMIPIVKEPLPVLKLATPAIPEQFLGEVLKTAAPTVKELAPLSKNAEMIKTEAKLPAEILGAFEAGHLAAYADRQTGNLEVYPSILRQKAVPMERAQEMIDRARTLAKQVFTRPEFFARDDTAWTLSHPMHMLGATVNRGGTDVKSTENIYLTYVAARRTVQGHSVFGPGSRALVAVGTDGTQQGLVRQWKTATRTTTVNETRTPEQVREAILRQLEPAQREGEVEVQSVAVGYYDANANYIQPVYRFTARIRYSIREVPGVTPTHKPVADDDFVVGYEPIGKALEPIPTLSAGLTGPHPGDAPPKERPVEKAVPPGDPTVGRYVVRNDDSNWVADANEFWNGLNPWFGAGRFTNSQYYWAMPWEFTTWEKYFVNSVNVALNEVHGNWWYFTTYQNWGDGVDITQIPASAGYGAAGGGQLDYWILHSCEVVPSAADAPCASDSRPWWSPWFNVFQGLHSVVGYRTIMYIDDDVGGPYGWNLWLGIPVVSGWFNAVASTSAYSGNPTATAHCGVALVMGKPSTISVCGHEDDNVYDTSPLPAASCLVNYWVN